MSVIAATIGGLGTIGGIIGIVLCGQDRSEVGTKWIGVGLGLLAVGILLTKIL